MQEEQPKQLATFGARGQSNDDGIFKAPIFAVACSPDGSTIWVSSERTVQVFSAEGVFLRHVAKNQWVKAAGICFSAIGQAFIADNGAHCIVVCNRDGKFVRRLVQRTSKGHSFAPGFIAMDTERHILFSFDNPAWMEMQMRNFVDDSIQCFDICPGDITFRYPRGIAVCSSTQEIAIVDHNSHNVRVFDYEGKSLRRFGGQGCKSGQFSYPYGVAVDSARNWVVTDKFNHRVQVFSADGQCVTCFGKHGNVAMGEFAFPTGVCVDRDGRVLVADGGNRRVQVFGFEFE